MVKLCPLQTEVLEATAVMVGSGFTIKLTDAELGHEIEPELVRADTL